MLEVYKHYGMEVSVVSKYKGKHKDICICHRGCKYFMPGDSDYCQFAADAFDLSKEIGLVLVMECKHFEPKV